MSWMCKTLVLLLGPSAQPGATSASEVCLTLQAEVQEHAKPDWEMVEIPFRWWASLEAAREAIVARVPSAVLLIATDPDARMVRVCTGARNRAVLEKDLVGHRWPGRQISPGGQSLLSASLPSDGLLAALIASGAPAERVGHPGLGVANRCFYGLLSTPGIGLIGCLQLPISLESARRHGCITPSRLNRATLLGAVQAGLSFTRDVVTSLRGDAECAQPAAR